MTDTLRMTPMTYDKLNNISLDEIRTYLTEAHNLKITPRFNSIEYGKNYYGKTKEDQLKKRKIWYLKNQEKLKAYRRERYKKMKEEKMKAEKMKTDESSK